MLRIHSGILYVLFNKMFQPREKKKEEKMYIMYSKSLKIYVSKSLHLFMIYEHLYAHMSHTILYVYK